MVMQERLHRFLYPEQFLVYFFTVLVSCKNPLQREPGKLPVGDGRLAITVGRARDDEIDGIVGNTIENHGIAKDGLASCSKLTGLVVLVEGLGSLQVLVENVLKRSITFTFLVKLGHLFFFHPVSLVFTLALVGAIPGRLSQASKENNRSTGAFSSPGFFEARLP